MSSDRDNQDLKGYADKLRGIDQKTLGQAKEVGKQLASEGKLQEVSGNAGPAATPRVQQAQGGPAERHRHVLDAKQQQLVASPPGGQAQQVPAAAKAPPDKSVAAVAKGSELKEIAAKLRESGVSGRGAANEVARPSEAQHQDQKKGRGR